MQGKFALNSADSIIRQYSSSKQCFNLLDSSQFCVYFNEVANVEATNETVQTQSCSFTKKGATPANSSTAV